MKEKLQKLTSLLLAVLMVIGIFPVAGATEAAAQEPDLRTEFTRPEDTAEAIDPEEWVTVIVELEGETTLDVEDFVEEFQQSSVGFSADSTVAAYRAQLVDSQTDIQTQIEAMIPQAQFRYHYTNLLNGFAARVQYKDIATIKGLTGVLDVYMTQNYDYADNWEDTEETVEYISLEEYAELYGEIGVDLEDGYYTDSTVFSDKGSVDQMGIQAAWEAGYTGAGKTVAIFDSSLRHSHELFQYMDPKVAEDHPETFKTKENLLAAITANEATINLFDSGWGSWFHGRPEDEQGFSEEVQAQIRDGEFYIREKVPFAVDYMDGDLEVWDGDSSSHGTHVAGITAGNPGPKDPTKPMSMSNVNGVLGGAYDAQIMFFKIFSEYDDFGQESDEAVFAALDDAVTLGADAFNLSLGIPNGFTTAVTYAQAGYQKAYNRAAAAGIAIAVAAGNDARSTHPGSLVSGQSTILPNSKTMGFSGGLLAPMTVASAQGTGYSYESYYNVTTMTIADGDGNAIEGLADITLVDNNAIPVGQNLSDTYEVVDCGFGSEEAILAATGAETLTDALVGKLALVQRGGDLTFLVKGENVQKAGAKGMILANNVEEEQALAASQIYSDCTTFGMFQSSLYTAFQDALKAGTVTVSFTTEEASSVNSREYLDNGPSSFTSWGVADSMKLKPDIMAPGGSILSAGASSDTALSTKSGTSMATPNMAGAFLLVQQYVDDNLHTFDVEKGTQAYNNLINWLVASNANVYAPVDESDGTVVVSRQNKYFSPRRQGAGMVDVSKVIASKVALHSDITPNGETGEQPRTKVDVGDKLGNTFEFHFVLENYNNAARTFDVLSCLQTDATKESAGRNVLVGVTSDGSDIEPIEDAVMTVKSVSGSASIDTESTNINRYAAAMRAAKITVPAKSSTTVTIEVVLDETTMAGYDRIFTNGMFLEGFVFFESAAEESVNIPFMGFRGDWTKAPIFDLATAYDDISGKTVEDADYPFYYATTMATSLPGANAGETVEAVLGANQYTGAAWPGYPYGGRYNSTREYLETLRADGSFKGSFSAISPDGDGYADIAYANLLLMRNAKVVYVEIKDAAGSVVRTIGPEFEYFEALNTDGNGTQQVAATYGTKYCRNLEWDGKNDAGQVVPEGQYTYDVYAITEKEFLDNANGAYIPSSNDWDQGSHTMTGITQAYKDGVLAQMKKSETKQSISMPVKVDTTAPVLNASYAEGTWTVTASDAGGSGIQALSFYYDGEKLGETTRVNGTTTSKTLNISEALSSIPNLDLSKLELQAVDYAFNIATITAEDAQSKLPATTVPAAPEVNASLPSDLTSEESVTADEVKEALHTTAANAVDGQGISEASQALAAADSTTQEAAESALARENVSTTGKTISIVVQTYVDITLKDVDLMDGAKKITLDITPKFVKVATTATEANDIALSGAGKNAVALDSGSLTITEPVTVSIPLPAGFAAGSLFVQHNKTSGRGYIYAGNVAEDVLTFTNPNGFSEFVIGVDAPAATINGVGYASFQDAVDEVADGGTIELAADASATVSRTVTFTVTGAAATINAGSNVTVTSSAVEGGTKYVCVYQRPSSSSSGRPSQQPTEQQPTQPTGFVDISGHWAESAIQTAVQAGLFNGTSANTFSPNVSVSRGMFATILYRLNGQPAVTGTSKFPDAVQGAWYYDASIWAADNAVVLGLADGTFAPNREITREQMAVMLHRYAVYAGHANDTVQPLTGYTDAALVSDWAAEALAWAVDNGYITGKPDSRLDPQGLATRAEAATILVRFLNQ